MKIPEHVALSFLLAQFGVQPEYGWAGTGLMVAAGCMPDSDGLTLVAGWRFYRQYHRRIGHGLPVTVLGPALLAGIGWAGGMGPFGPLWGWLQMALLVHLFTDVAFYNWPVQLLWPLSQRGFELGLLKWNDLVPTLILYAASLVALFGSPLALPAAAAGVGLLGLYLPWRAWRPAPQSGWPAWLTGGWALREAPVWKWLTGDFIT
jgi:hypothetical protein